MLLPSNFQGNFYFQNLTLRNWQRGQEPKATYSFMNAEITDKHTFDQKILQKHYYKSHSYFCLEFWNISCCRAQLKFVHGFKDFKKYIFPLHLYLLDIISWTNAHHKFNIRKDSRNSSNIQEESKVNSRENTLSISKDNFAVMCLLGNFFQKLLYLYFFIIIPYFCIYIF